MTTIETFTILLIAIIFTVYYISQKKNILSKIGKNTTIQFSEEEYKKYSSISSLIYKQEKTYFNINSQNDYNKIAIAGGNLLVNNNLKISEVGQI